MGKLFLVATPIGNPRDITLRALDILAAVPLVACEDTRTTRRLLREHSVGVPRLISYNEHNRDARIPGLLAALEEGDVALVSEAGMPGISDPGQQLVSEALEAGYEVVPIPGPSAVLSALAASGLSARRFLFVGFLPRKRGERRTALADLADLDVTIVCFESPRRVRGTLEDIVATLGDRRVVAAREISKRHEEFLYGSANEVFDRLENPLGEFTLVISGPGESYGSESAAADVQLVEVVAALRDQGHSTRDIAAQLTSSHGLSRRKAYRAAMGKDS